VVSDLELRRPIWFGGTDRSEASLNEFFRWLGPEKSGRIRLDVMDMWKAFRNSTLQPGHAPQAMIVYDKFHILRHLGTAMDVVRKQEYARLVGDVRRYIKGKKYLLLSRWHNLSKAKQQTLKELFRVNQRLCKAYLLKESFLRTMELSSSGMGSAFL
jgi:transposase